MTARAAIRSAFRRARGRSETRRRAAVEPAVALVGLLVLTVVALALALGQVGWFPLTFFVVPLVLGGVLLQRPQLLVLDAAVLVTMVASVAVLGVTGVRIGALVVMVFIAATVYVSVGTSRLGAGGLVGESMIIDLRDRLRQQGVLPVLPPQWYAQAVMRSADGASFAGDFIVAAKTRGSSLLEVVVVDVSGKGLAAGTRALQLSGAFGGLLGALTPDQFLPAANDYLMRQDWDEGFATAAHLALSIDTGHFELRTAGHPPAVQWSAGSGRWTVHASSGPVLGVLESAEFVPVHGRLLHGDVMMLYTDGVVETRSQDFVLGIDKLIGQAERLMSTGWENGAERLLQLLDEPGDDRAIFFVHRR